jgi:hypothetical protein
MKIFKSAKKGSHIHKKLVPSFILQKPTYIIGGFSYNHLQVLLFHSITCKKHIIFIYPIPINVSLI